LGDDNADGVHVHNKYDAIFGDGSDMNINLPDDSAVDAKAAAAIKTFNEKLAELRIENCPGCCEEGFHIKLTPQDLCSRCSGDNSEPPPCWSQNEPELPPNLVPPCLQYLTDMEEMLIARTKTTMQVRWTKG
ncbi:hypothetical protein K438DRAFT_1542727, partial [Mycena galopus ATCC 62051]